MKRKSIVSICLLFCSASAMEKNLQKLEERFVPMWHIASTGQAPHPVREDMLAQILPAAQCALEGTIQTLIARPKSGWRTKEQKLFLTKFGVKGDRCTESEMSKRRLQAVSLMRSDVSHALGGAPMPGDDIHVSGLDIGQNSLACGGLIVVKDPKELTIKAVLLKTAIEYYANKKIQNRCGSLAVDFLHAEGQYARSEASPVHGLRDRLRGLKLAVLKEGEVCVGDRVFICNAQDAEWILKEYDLEAEYQSLVEQSVEEAERVKEQNVAEKFERYMASWRAKQSCCNGLGAKGVAVVSSVFSLLLLGAYYLG